jgi:hypothetical protein
MSIVVFSMERRTYDQLFGSFSNEQFQQNILMNQFITFNPMCSSIRGVHSMYRKEMTIIEFLFFVLTAALGEIFLRGANDSAS